MEVDEEDVAVVVETDAEAAAAASQEEEVEEEEEEELTAQEIAEYARGTLDIDPVWDAELLWIAAEGLRAPLPDGWTEVRSNKNCVLHTI